jgi:hypothetical protein
MERFKRDIEIMRNLVIIKKKKKFTLGSSKHYKTLRDIRGYKECLFSYGVK